MEYVFFNYVSEVSFYKEKCPVLSEEMSILLF